MDKQFFGTDGIRGRVGQHPVTPDFMLKLGWACGRVFARAHATDGVHSLVLIGKDTRVSGYMFESALEAGLVAAGVDVTLLGPMPTPAVALMTRSQQAQAGIVISASHNPYYDNGIKFFDSTGHKLEDAVELEIERELALDMETVDSANLGKATKMEDASGRYIEFCKSTVPHQFSLRGLKIVVDCAHGATYNIAPLVFEELGAEVISLGTSPDGFNINEGFGSTDTANLAAGVRAEGADVGIALDGDGDRVIFIDANGDIVDGDELLFIIAEHKCYPGVVGTLMSNLGMELALKERGVKFARANVGDRYVNEMMQARGWPLGGESSGHVICSELTTTGDGIVAALQVLQAMRDGDADLASLKNGMSKFPQHMINVAMSDRTALEDNAEVATAVSEVEESLGNRGRVLLRPSGTEPVVRVMVEGEDAAEVESLCQSLADRVAAALSA